MKNEYSIEVLSKEIERLLILQKTEADSYSQASDSINLAKEYLIKASDFSVIEDWDTYQDMLSNLSISTAVKKLSESKMLEYTTKIYDLTIAVYILNELNND